MTQLQHVVQILHALLQVAPHVAAVSPVVEPAHPELRAHQRTALRILLKHLEALLRPGTEIPRGQRPGQMAAGKGFVHGAVGRYQRHRHAPVDHVSLHGLQISRIIPVIAVLVFHLHQDHRAALIDLQGRDDRKQHVIILSDMLQEGLVAASQAHPVLL